MPGSQEQIERRLISRLRRLERDWPDGYSLNSMAGELYLMREPAFSEELGRLDPDQIVESFGRIPSAGGDW